MRISNISRASVLQEAERAAAMRAAKETTAARLAAAGIIGAYLCADSPEGRDACARLARGRGVYLFGAPGRGKTWAAAQCVRQAIERGKSARLITVAALLEEEKTGAGDGLAWQAFRAAARLDLLALDDIGAELASAWAVAGLVALVDARAAAGRLCVFTSNFSLGDLRKKYGDHDGARLASRIAGACDRVEVCGHDRRLAPFAAGKRPPAAGVQIHDETRGKLCNNTIKQAEGRGRGGERAG